MNIKFMPPGQHTEFEDLQKIVKDIMYIRNKWVPFITEHMQKPVTPLGGMTPASSLRNYEV